MSDPNAKPISPSKKSERARHIYAAMMDGRSLREIAEAEGLGVRRIQQIVAEELARRKGDPANDYALLQIARLEQAQELLGAKIDAGEAAAVPAFLRVIEQLSKLTQRQLHLGGSAAFRLADEADEMEERFERLAIAREVLAERRARRRRAESEGSAKPNAPQVLEITAERRNRRFRAPIISRTCERRSETFFFRKRNFQSEAKFSLRKRNFRFVSASISTRDISLRKGFAPRVDAFLRSERGVGGSGAEIASIRRPGFCAKKTIGEFHRSRRSGRRSRVIRSASSRRQFPMRA